MSRAYLHINHLIFYTFILISICAIVLYVSDQKTSSILRNLTAESREMDLPTHRLRSQTGHGSTKLIDLLRRADYEEALLHLEEMLSGQSENAALYFYAGSLSERLGHWIKAEKYFEKARMNSTLFYNQSLKKLALLYYQQDDVPSCHSILEDLKQVASSRDSNWVSQFERLL